jgi:SAM-dependent methyltransferase
LTADRPHTERIIEASREARDREAEVYDERNVRAGWELQAQDACLRRVLSLEPGQTLVDAGCGTGRHLPWLLADGRRVIAADYSERSLEIARTRVPADAGDRVELHAADVRRLPVEDGVADRVLCAEVLGDLPDEQHRLEALRELLRVTRPGGVVVVSGYRWLGRVRRREGFWEGTTMFFHTFRPGELRTLLRRAGFAEVTLAGAPVLPKLFKRLRPDPDLQGRLSVTPLGPRLGHFLIARGVRPA